MPKAPVWRITTAVALAAAFVFPVGAAAVTRSTVTVDPVGDFVVEPAKIEFSLDPGETVTKQVTVTSRISGETEFTVSLEDFVGTEDGAYAVRLLGDEASPYSFRSAINPEVDRFTLSLGERITVPVTISAPASAAPGGYYTSVVIAGDQGGAPAGGGANVVSRVAQLLFVRVNGEVEESGALLDFRMSPEGFWRAGGPFRFEALFQNSGSVHLAPYGAVTVRNLFGTTVAEVPVDAYYAMPKSMRYRTIDWPGKPMLGYYTAELELWKGYRLGADEPVKASVSFFVLPWGYLLGAALAILAVWLIARYVRRNFEFKRR